MTATATQLIQEFIYSITVDLELYQTLSSLLREQKSIYLAFDNKALKDNIAQQMPLLEQLNTNAEKRSLNLRKLGLANDEQSVQRIFNALPSKLSIKVSNQWHSLKRLINDCHQLNQSNGQSSAAFHEIVFHIKYPAQHTYEEPRF